MIWHESDSELQKKFLELKKEESIVYKRLKRIRTFKTYIENLKMIVVTQELNDPSKTTYENPKDNGGNKMDNDHKEEQKSSLIINIDEFLGTNVA